MVVAIKYSNMRKMPTKQNQVVEWHSEVNQHNRRDGQLLPGQAGKISDWIMNWTCNG